MVLSFVGALAVGGLYALVAWGGLRIFGPAGPRVFPSARGVLAQLEFNGDVLDSSGNGRHGVLLGGEFRRTEWGEGLSVQGGTPGGQGMAPPFVKVSPMGVDWSVHAHLITIPYTIELVITPNETRSYAKIFGSSDARDEGLYYQGGGITVYPHASAGDGKLTPGERHYIAVVASTPGELDVYVQGKHVVQVPSNLSPPVSEAIFFRDDVQTSRGEQLDGIVEALRISSVARTPAEIAAVQRRLESR